MNFIVYTDPLEKNGKHKEDEVATTISTTDVETSLAGKPLPSLLTLEARAYGLREPVLEDQQQKPLQMEDLDEKKHIDKNSHSQTAYSSKIYPECQIIKHFSNY